VSQQLVAPLEGRLQRLVPRLGSTAARGEQLEAVLQPIEYLLWRERTKPHGGQLNRQRDTLQPTNQLRDGRCVHLVHREGRQHACSPAGKQPDRLRAEYEVGRRRISNIRQRHRGHWQHSLPSYAERLTAGRKDPYVAARSQDRL